MKRRSPLFLALAAVALAAAPAAAQTSFTWPDTAVDLTTYTTPEACQAAVDRTRQSLRDREDLARGVWRDTLVFDPGERSIPPAVSEAARSCLSRFSAAESVPLEDYRSLLRLYLTADWTDRARTLVERRLEAVNPEDAEELAAVADTVVALFSDGSTPMAQAGSRLDLLDEVLVDHLPNGVDRLRAYWAEWRRVTEAAIVNEEQVDTVVARQVATRLIGVAESLTPAEREAAWEEATTRWRLRIDDPEGLTERLNGALDYVLSWPAFLDRLREGTAPYVEAVRAAREDATGRPSEAYFRGITIGETAPALEGDIWLGCDETCEARPRAGRVSLVAFLSHDQCSGVPIRDAMLYENCAGRLISLRRVMERNPEVDVTVVAVARGNVGYVKEDVTPEREAELLRRWLDSFGLERAVLTLSVPEHWRLPNHDGRRVDPPVANHTNYTFGMPMVINNGMTYLIDQDGIVVHDWFLVRETESEFTERIHILLERGGAAS